MERKRFLQGYTAGALAALGGSAHAQPIGHTFREWISGLRWEKSMVGHLAYEVFFDDTWPDDAVCGDEIWAYLAAERAPDPALDAFKQAWERFRAAMRRAGRGDVGGLRLIDDPLAEWISHPDRRAIDWSGDVLAQFQRLR